MFRFILNLVPRPYLIKISYLVRPFLVLFYKGNNFEDPIDGKKFRKLLPYGYGKQRQNALSPSTLSLERHRLLWLYLQKETDFFTKPKKVLHLAPEQCFINRFKKQKNLDYITADLYSPIVDVKADILDLPFKEGAFIVKDPPENSPAFLSGLKKGDIILEIENQKITPSFSLRKLIRRIKKKTLHLKIFREGKIEIRKIEIYD